MPQMYHTTISIEDYQYHFYQRVTSGVINYNDEICIAIRDLEASTAPCDCLLHIGGELTKNDDTAATKIELINNAISISIQRN